MICQRCGHCCVDMGVVVIVDGRTKWKPPGVRCPHLTVGPDGRAHCAVHHARWYRKTPCNTYGNAELDPDYAANPTKPCAVGTAVHATHRDVLAHAQTVDQLEDLGPYVIRKD